MSIGHIQPEGGVNPLKDQQVNQTAHKGLKPGEQTESAKVGGDSVELSDRAKLFQEVNTLKKELAYISDPNEGRIEELKKSIADGTLVSDQVIDETAQILANQLLS